MLIMIDLKTEKFLANIARKAGYDFSKVRKQAFGNPMENSMYATMLKGALKSLEVISLLYINFKITAITKLLQALIQEWEDELVEKRLQEAGGGYVSEYADSSFSYNFETDPYSNLY